MSYKRKSWREKLADSKGFPKIRPIDSTKSKRWGTGTFVIPAPMEVHELMRQVPKGRITTIDEIRKALARRHGATMACPITTGIFAWISAHAAAEAAAEGQEKTNPFWRTLKSNGELNPKYPGGIAGLKRQLSAEGHRVVQRGKRFFVQEFQGRLVLFDDCKPGKSA
jgi:alkylated DNA nucleotide flippase Atl1